MGLKIAFITPWRVRCGIATYSEKLVNALAGLGVEIYVVRLSRFGFKTADSLQALVRKIPVDRIDLIHIQHEYGLYQSLEQYFYVALKALGKPVVTTMHAVGVRLDVDAGIAASSDRVIVHNQFCRSKLGFEATIIAHGASLCETVPPEKAKTSWALQPEAPIVGYCGFVSEYKGLETLIGAMTKVKAGLLIAGGWHTAADTSYILALKQRSVNLLPGRCQWLGFVPDERLSDAYGAMDVVVYPSRFATESGALIMALSHGKAVLASRIGPFKEKEKVGALMTFKGVEDLRRKIKKLLKDDELRATLEDGARKYVKSVEWKEVAKKHIELYKEVLNR